MKHDVTCINFAVRSVKPEKIRIEIMLMSSSEEEVNDDEEYTL